MLRAESGVNVTVCECDDLERRLQEQLGYGGYTLSTQASRVSALTKGAGT